jgi:hypothetical protein
LIAVNGGLCGYFKGERGLRQCDPLSPYPFLISMEVLFSVLDSTVADGEIGFHPRCKKIALTLIYVLRMIFTSGTPKFNQQCYFCSLQDFLLGLEIAVEIINLK